MAVLSFRDWGRGVCFSWPLPSQCVLLHADHHRCVFMWIVDTGLRSRRNRITREQLSGVSFFLCFYHHAFIFFPGYKHSRQEIQCRFQRQVYRVGRICCVVDVRKTVGELAVRECRHQTNRACPFCWCYNGCSAVCWKTMHILGDGVSIVNMLAVLQWCSAAAGAQLQHGCTGPGACHCQHAPLGIYLAVAQWCSQVSAMGLRKTHLREGLACCLHRCGRKTQRKSRVRFHPSPRSIVLFGRTEKIILINYCEKKILF